MRRGTGRVSPLYASRVPSSSTTHPIAPPSTG
jgi:hypothetical protein